MTTDRNDSMNTDPPADGLAGQVGAGGGGTAIGATLDPTLCRVLLLGPAAVTRLTAEVTGLIQAGPSAFANLWGVHEVELRAFAAAQRLGRGDSRYWFSEGIARHLDAQQRQQQRDRERRTRPVAASLQLPINATPRVAITNAATVQRQRIHRTPAMRAGDRAVAIHESAHAIVGLLVGASVSRAELRLDLQTPSYGRVEFAPEELDVTPGVTGAAGPSAHDFSVMLLAGGEAERRLVGAVAHGHDHDDIARARLEFAVQQRDAADPAIDQLLDAARIEAAAAVREHWPWITRVADSLRAHRTLDAAQILALRDEPPSKVARGATLLSDTTPTAPDDDDQSKVAQRATLMSDTAPTAPVTTKGHDDHEY